MLETRERGESRAVIGGAGGVSRWGTTRSASREARACRSTTDRGARRHGAAPIWRVTIPGVRGSSAAKAEQGTARDFVSRSLRNPDDPAPEDHHLSKSPAWGSEVYGDRIVDAQAIGQGALPIESHVEGRDRCGGGVRDADKVDSIVITGGIVPRADWRPSAQAVVALQAILSMAGRRLRRRPSADGARRPESRPKIARTEGRWRCAPRRPQDAVGR